METLNQLLQEKQNELNNVNGMVNDLNMDLLKVEQEKRKLEDEYRLSKIKLQRAQILIENLGDEKDRWKEFSEELERDQESILGDILVCSGITTYLGPFVLNF